MIEVDVEININIKHYNCWHRGRPSKDNTYIWCLIFYN